MSGWIQAAMQQNTIIDVFFSIVGDFNVVVGDSNLKIDLPFGVQTHEISQVIVHENYRPDDKFHYEDIGKF